MKTNEATLALRLARGDAMRLLFFLSLGWGVLLFWLAPHLPMLDLPQHAAQVTLLRDMLLGESPWSEQFRINPLTPYVLGYGLALPLSFVMPISAALKLLLSLAYVAFVATCVQLRRHFDADPRLDWLFLVSFFGFAYQWGFFTFLLSAPVALWFILTADRYALARTTASAWAVVGVGLILLASHGLMFVFAFSVGAALVAARWPSPRALLRAWSPFAMLGAVCAAYLLVSLQANEGMQTVATAGTVWGGGLARAPKTVADATVGYPEGTRFVVLAAIAFALLAIPWLLGLRIRRRGNFHWIPFATLLAAVIVAPTFAVGTAYLYQRFALFLLPAYAWMFSAGPPSARPPRFAAPALALLVALSWTVLAVHSARTWQFGREAADFDSLLGLLEPRQRALGMVLDPYSAADGAARIYLHYPAWYQAERQGLVDFNFAWFLPQIVRYRRDRLPAVAPGFEWNPDRFDWTNNRGGQYRYFLVRHAGAVPAGLFAGAPCAPKALVSRGRWTVFERCPG